MLWFSSYSFLTSSLSDVGVPIDTPVKRKIWTCSINGNQRVWDPRDDPHLAEADREGGPELTALHYAVLTGGEIMTKFLLEHGANVNAVSQYGETYLHVT